MIGKARKINWMFDTKGKLWQHTQIGMNKLRPHAQTNQPSLIPSSE